MLKAYINKTFKLFTVSILILCLFGCQKNEKYYLIYDHQEKYEIPQRYVTRLSRAYENIKNKYSEYEITRKMTFPVMEYLSNEKEYYVYETGLAGDYICDPYEEYFDIWREFVYFFKNGEQSSYCSMFYDPTFIEKDKYVNVTKEHYDFWHVEFANEFTELPWETYFTSKDSDFNTMSQHFYNCSDPKDDGKTILDIYLELTNNSPKLNQEVIYKGFRFKSIGFNNDTHVFFVKLDDNK